MQVSSSSGWQWSAFKVWFDSHPASLSLSLSVSLSRYLSLSSAPLASLPLSSSPLSLSSQPASLYLSKLVVLSPSLSSSLSLSFLSPSPPLRPCSPTCLSVPLVLPLNILFQVQTLARTRSCSLPHSRRSLRSAPSLPEALSPCLLTSFSLLVFFFPFSLPLSLSPSAPLPCLFSPFSLPLSLSVALVFLSLLASIPLSPSPLSLSFSPSRSLSPCLLVLFLSPPLRPFSACPSPSLPTWCCVSSSSGWQWSAFKVWFESHPASLSLSLSLYVSLSIFRSVGFPASLYLSKLFSHLPFCPISLS